MALQTPTTPVDTSDNFEQWFNKTNDVINEANQTVQDVGDLSELDDGTSTNLVDAINTGRNFSIAISIALG